VAARHGRPRIAELAGLHSVYRDRARQRFGRPRGSAPASTATTPSTRSPSIVALKVGHVGEERCDS
jgi:hypothetical protein